jgi:hypothetical protein
MVTTKDAGSASRKGATMAGMPEAVAGAGGSQKIMVKMVSAVNGLNVGEIGRFRRDVVARMLDRGQAVLHREAMAASKTGVAVSKAMKAIHRANDAKKLVAVQLRDVQSLVNDADQLTQEAFAAVDVDLAGSGDGVDLLVESDKIAQGEALEAVKIQAKKIKEAKGNVTKAKRSLKTSDDKEAGQALVEDAESAVASAEASGVIIKEHNEAAQEARTAAIENFGVSDGSLEASVNENIKELESLLDATRELDEELSE